MYFSSLDSTDKTGLCKWESRICLLLLLMFHSRSFHLPTRSAFQAACCRPCVPVGPLSVASWQLAANACTVKGTAHVPAEKGKGREGKEEGGKGDAAGGKLDSSRYSFIFQNRLVQLILCCNAIRTLIKFDYGF